jgi:hypothetical protein
MHPLGIQMTEPHSLHFFAGPPGIATALTYFRRTENIQLGLIHGIEQKIKSVPRKKPRG